MNRKRIFQYIKQELELMEIDFEDLSDRISSLKAFVAEQECSGEITHLKSIKIN